MDPNGGIGPTGPRLDTNSQQNLTPQANQDIGPAMTQGAPISMPSSMPIGEPQQPSSSAPSFMESNLPMAPSGTETAPPDNIQTDLLPITPTGPDNKKIIIIAVISVVVCLLLAGAMFFVGFTTGKAKGKLASDAAWQQKEAERQKAEDAKNKDDSADTAEALDLKDLKDPNYIDETIKGEVGEQTEASDGLVLKVTNIERNFKTDDANYKLDPTKELVKVNFLIGNITKDKPKDISNFNFRLENSVDAKLVPENLTDYTDKFDAVKLDPGAQSKASIVYLVNKDEKPLKFIREQRYRISGGNQEVTTRTEIVIAK